MTESVFTNEAQRDRDVDAYTNYFTRLISNYPILQPYISDYLSSFHGYLGIAYYLSEIGQSPEQLHGQVVLDIGGGSLRTDETASGFKFYPWYSICMGLAGASVINIDRPFDKEEVARISHSNAFVHLIQTLYKHRIFDISHGFAHGDKLIEFIEKNDPGTIGNVDLVHSHYLTSFDLNNRENSPYFMESIGISTKDHAVPKTKRNIDRLNTAGFGIISFAQKVLKEGGHLNFNSLTYRKVGDNMVWISGGNIIQSPIP